LLQFAGWVLNAEARLEPLEIAAAVAIEDDDFAVKNGAAGADLFRERGEFGIFAGDVATGAREEAGLAAVDEGEDADTVEFDFVEPGGVVGGRILAERGESGREEARHWGFLRVGQFGGMGGHEFLSRLI